MSHHYSGHNDASPRADARLDITDLYAFPKPGVAGRSILIMNVHPSYSLTPPRPTTSEPFAPEAVYELRIDTNDDLEADIVYRLRVSTSPGGAQIATLGRAEGVPAAGMADAGCTTIADGIQVSTGSEAPVTEAGAGHHVFVGRRSDPFFFDLRGAMRDFQFDGDDFFADKDVYSLVLDVPNTALGDGPVSLWARVLVPDNSASGGWAQVERGARPSQTPFLAGEVRDAYLAAEPKDDGQFVEAFAHGLVHSGGYAPEAATSAAKRMLPDILHYDPLRPASYPSNGRALTDDVSDLFLPILTNGKVTTDKVGPHRDLLAEFPYLGPPHAAG